VAALGESYGRGAMTQHWIDIKNSDVVMCLGSNAAENHPISFKWVTAAMNDPTKGPSDVPNPGGAKLIVVDPRYTRSAAKASYWLDGKQLYCKIRSGTDIAFVNGMMKWAIDHGRVNYQYVRDCTNARFLLNPGFQTCRVTNPVYDNLGFKGNFYGVFSGLVDDPRRHKKFKYNKGATGTNPGNWSYQYVTPIPPPPTEKNPLLDTTGAWADDPGTPPQPFTYLKGTPDPNSVWAKLIEQVSVYTLDNVSKICGAPQADIERVYDAYTSTYIDTKSANIMYAMGSTQHTYGSQNVRAYSMIQLLLGNVGVAGGGINALRGESNVQGSTDQCLLYHILPGYLPYTTNAAGHKDRASYKATTFTNAHQTQDPTPGGGPGNPVSLAWWRQGPKYIDSLLQAWWPTFHTGHPNLDTAYQYLPKADQNFWYTHT
jgi:formate dehydrogenase major subunit